MIDEEGIGSFAHVPLSIGARLFGVLTVADERPDLCDDALLARMEAFGLAAAGAIANALDFARERRVALALTRGFVPGPLPELEGFDAGLVFEPSGHAAGGGDFFGIWRLPNGSVALLVGDVSGKGIEVAAISSMVRFFVEARTYDAADPAEVMRQTNALLRGRLPGITFVPAVMMVIDEQRIRWCNAGHTPPRLIAAGGEELELRGTGLPLGLEEGEAYTAEEAPLGPGDLVFACTDGLTEARREGRQFGDERLAGLLAEHARELDARGLVRLLHREAEAWAPALDDDVVDPRAAAAAVIEVRHEPPDGPRRSGAVGRVHGARARARRPRLRADRAHLRHRRRLPRPERGLDRALRRRTRRWPAPGCASSSPGWRRSSACS